MKKNLQKNIKRDLSRYLTQEEGKVVKGNIVKLAIALGIIGFGVSDADAGGFAFPWDSQHGSSSKHTNFLHNSASDGAYHNSGHASHSSHGSHGAWYKGW